MPLVSTFGNLSARAFGLGAYRSSIFSPLSLFAAGEQGVWYDPSDLITMFEDKAGTTPVHTPGNGVADSPVGALLDKRNSAYSVFFDGTGDYITAPYSTSAFDWWTSDYTVEAWVYAVTFTGWGRNMVGNFAASSTGGANYWNFGPNSSGKVVFDYWTGASNSTVTSTQTLAAGQWNHIAMTKTSGGITLFVNGVANTTTAIVGTPQSATGTPLAMGGYSTPSINGYLSNVRIVKGTAVYSGNFTPPTSPLTAISGTSLLTCGTSWSGNPTFTISGDTKVAATSPFVSSYSNYFDGTGDYITAPYSTSSFDWWTGDYTIEAWVYARSFSNWQDNTATPKPNMVGNMTPASNTNYWSFGPVSNGTVVFFYYNGSTANYVTSTPTVSVNQWNHVAMTKTSSGITLFVNGVANTVTAISGTPQSSAGTTLSIGSLNGYSINGYISNLRIVKGTAVYTANFTVPTAPLTAITNTQLLTCGNDSWSGNPALTLVGDTKPTFQTPFNTTAITGNHATQATSTARPTLSARYNLLTYSEQFDNAYWAKSAGTVTANATTAPDGTTTADLFTSANSTAVHAVYNNTTLAITSGLSYTARIYLKAGTQRYVQFYFGQGQNQAQIGIVIDTTTMTIVTAGGGTSGTLVSSSATNVGSGWYLFTITGSVTTTIGAFVVATSDQTAYNTNPVSTGNGTIYIWGADLRVANDGVGLPVYQRIADANTYDSVGFPYYIKSDGVDDALTTASINWGTNRVTLNVGIRNLSSGADNAAIEFYNGTLTGAWSLNRSNASSWWKFYSNGGSGTDTTGAAQVIPFTEIITATGYTAGTTNVFRENGTQTGSNTATQGSGNYGTYPIWMLKRYNGTLLWAGRLYGAIARGASSTATEISNTETWLNTKTKAY